MASLGCGIDSIIERIEKIKSILRKYSLLSQGVANYAALKNYSFPLELPLKEWFSGLTGSGTFKTLFDGISSIYGYVKQGIQFVKDVEKEIQQVVKDFGDVVENLNGILQDLRDLTVLDIQVLELDLAKLGLNPGEILTRIKNGEDPDVVLAQYKEALSEQSKALLEKINKPLTINIDLTCQKLPNVVLIELGNVRKTVILPTKPQATRPEAKIEPQVPAPITTYSGYTAAQQVVLETVKKKKDGTYNFAWLQNGHDMPEYRHSWSQAAWANIMSILKSRGLTKVDANNKIVGITPELIEANADAIGYYIVKPLKDMYGPQVKVTSGWRPYNVKDGFSAHNVGCAIDIQFPLGTEHFFTGVTDSKNANSAKKPHPIKFLYDQVFSKIDIQVPAKGPSGQSTTMKVGQFRVLREIVKEKPASDVYPTHYHIHANFVLPGFMGGNAYGFSPPTDYLKSSANYLANLGGRKSPTEDH